VLLVLAFVAGVMANLPASVAGWALARASHETWWLCNSEGTLWAGSAQWALKSPESEPVLLPGRVHWQIDATWAGLKLVLTLPSPGGNEQQVGVLFSPRHGYLDAGQLRLPARLLGGLGAPFNTLGLEGELMMEWPASIWNYRPLAPVSPVSSKIELRGVSARVTPVSPMGTYQLGLEWGPAGGSFNLITLTGPLMLSGQGSFQSGRAFRFDGQAQADAAMQGQMNGLLSILGQQEGGITRLHY
jgi:general secretion pathway protein N